MLIHITPRYYLKYSDVLVDLIDVSIPEISLTLKSGTDITLRTPHPNKNYKVACRKKGLKAINGILIETDKPLSNFTVITRWVVNAGITTHTVHYHISDKDFDAVSEEKFLWNGFYGSPFRSRNPSDDENPLSIRQQPSMVTLPDDFDDEQDEMSWIYNETGEDGLVTQRVEYFTLPTIEPERLTVPFAGNKRLPPVEHAIQAKSSEYALTIVPGEYRDFGTHIVPLAEWITEVRREGAEDNLIQVLEDIRSRTPVFISNTDDLLNKAAAFSPTFNGLSDGDKKAVVSEFRLPVFHVIYSEAETAE